MNKKIMEVAEATGIDIDNLEPRDLRLLEKFANNIIDGCISACATESLGKTAGAAELMKNYFGIEE